MKLTLELAQGYARALMTEQFSEAELEPCFIQIRDFMLNQKLERLLLDWTGIQGPLSVMDRFSASRVSADQLAHVSRRMAVLIREDQQDPERIGVMVARNRGLLVELFTGQAAALAWLLQTYK